MILYRFPFTLTVVLAIRSGDRASLPRVIEGLKGQQMPKRHWRLVVVDERPPKRGEEDLAPLFAWHPRVSLLRVEADGAVAPARIRAMLSARTDLVLALEARTILAPDYLSEAMRLAEEHPFVGIFGGDARFADGAPGPGRWQRRFARLLGLCRVSKPLILQEARRRFMPSPSAFMVRREHLRRMSHILRRHPFFQEAGFIAEQEAFDYRAAFARTVVQTGFSMGLFPSLRHARILFASDLKERQLRERIRGEAFSRVLERFIWTGLLPEVRKGPWWEELSLRWLKSWQAGRESRLRAAHHAGIRTAARIALTHSQRPVPAVTPSAPIPRPASKPQATA